MALNGYTKLFSSILASTIWREPNHVRLVWITLLAMADKDGVCEASVPGLADLARVPIADCEDALRTLAAADPYSRTSDHDGRRIEPVDGGWLLLNHAKYREKMNQEERREYLRLKKAESRARQQTVNKCQQASTLSTQAEAAPDPDSQAKSKEQEKAAALPVQGSGAFERGSLPRDHITHVVCGPAMKFCLTPKVYNILADIYNDSPDATKAALKGWLGKMETMLAQPGQSKGDLKWIIGHFNAWCLELGRVAAPPKPAAPAYRGMAVVLAEEAAKKAQKAGAQ